MPIEPNSAVPKYHQLFEILRQKIDDSEWKPHEAIPSNRDLSEIYGVSMTTVREALDIMSNQGLIYRKHGLGTFVASPKFQHTLTQLQTFTNDMKARGLSAGQKIINFSFIAPSSSIQQRLELDDDKNILRIERLRLSDGEPLGIHTSYLPINPDNSFTQDQLDQTGSLYILLAKLYNLVPVEADETIEAINADERMANLLDVEKGASLLLLKRITLSSEHRPMEYVEMLHRADRYKCYVHLTY